ncbi:Asp-tRNA(Asn)/Glu-tRNA(Gln) amidotransferase subunit GatA [Candidatus Woesearchaeota archaeon]|nr:Asp-tRNA(Asn)/Glu-tRNA(Gln) amidotransferase subunit GatA [Candidatus Woesearchaeota archaeon]
MVEEILQQLKTGKVTALEHIQQLLKVIEQKNKKINALLYVNNNAAKEAEAVDKKIKAGKAGRLAGLGIAVKANMNVIGMPISCASRTLENYYGTYDADVIVKIKQEDGIIIGIANCDEFAAGSTGEYSAFGATDNPVAPGFVPGGSSSGSAAAVAAGMADLALGSDTGGSIRAPASFCGVIGIKPSYGRVSRYGLIDLSMSLDQIGPLSRDVFGSALAMEIIAGKSNNDPTTINMPIGKYTHFQQKKIRIGMSKSFETLTKDRKIYAVIQNAAEKIAKALHTEIVDVELDYLDLAVQTYYPLVYVEFFSSTRKFDGRKYGKKIEDACGEEVLRRILGGREISRAEYHGTYYRKALKAKKLIAIEFERAFQYVDVILAPTTPVLPHKLGAEITDPKVIYAYDAFTIPANLAGICAGVVPADTVNGIPAGLQIMAPAFKEEVLFGVMKVFEGLQHGTGRENKRR